MARNRTLLAVIAALAPALITPSSGQAASARPAVRTGAAANIAQQTVRLTGSVDPNGRATTFFFQYGPTSLYGATTSPGAAPAAGGRVAVVTDVAGLAPATRYHYRLIAQNAHGLVRGSDRSFRTRRQPLGVSLAATPDPVPFGSGTTLAGTLTGTGNAGRAVVLQANPFPYTQGFANLGNPQLTDAQGGFAFPVPAVALNTQYRVLMPQKPTVASPIVSVGVAVRVSTRVRRHRARRGIVARFSGTVRPARDGAQVAIQKLHGTTWVTVAGTITHHGAGTFSRYAKRVRIRRGGTFRVYVGIVDGNYVSNTGRSVRVRVHG